MQRDSLFPLLFVLCIDPLSKKLNSLYNKVLVDIKYKMHKTNYLFFVDNLKLLTHDKAALNLLTKETQQFFKTISLEINYKKSTTNAKNCTDSTVMLKEPQGYKYLNLIKNSKSRPTKENFNKIK